MFQVIIILRRFLFLLFFTPSLLSLFQTECEKELFFIRTLENFGRIPNSSRELNFLIKRLKGRKFVQQFSKGNSIVWAIVAYNFLPTRI